MNGTDHRGGDDSADSGSSHDRGHMDDSADSGSSHDRGHMDDGGQPHDSGGGPHDGEGAPHDGEGGEAMTAEFDTVAAWTEEVVGALGQDHAVPAACRGSASPADLAWLAEALELGPDMRFLDAGAGLGGPAAWVAQRYVARPVLAEPMVAAAQGALRIFGLASVAAWSERLPFRAGSFDAAWALGVLSAMEHKAGLLAEVRRVLRPAGSLGLLVFLATCDPLPLPPPEGNHFPTPESMRQDLDDAGFEIAQEVGGASLADAPMVWRHRMERVEDELGARHGGDPQWTQAAEQQDRIGALLEEGLVVSRLVHAVAR